MTITDEQIKALLASAKEMLHLLKSTMDESGRSIEWGEEDAFRMGEWFDSADALTIEEAEKAIRDVMGSDDDGC